MNIYFAPMEGITGYLFRNAFEKTFPGIITKYYAPFISSGVRKGVAGKDLKQLSPDNNLGICLVPQLLTNDPADFENAALVLRDLGYEEINLNLGCPSQTVVSKNRGAGLLADPDRLDSFLEKASDFSVQNNIRLSVKTRLGFSDTQEFPVILGIYEKYPLSELIIHLRLRTDYYKLPCHTECFDYAVENSGHRLVYNGDICSRKDVECIAQHYPGIGSVMIGRGFLKDPCMLYDPDKTSEFETAGNGAENAGTGTAEISGIDRSQKLWQFHNLLYASFKEEMSGQRNVLFKMKEIWSYMNESFDQGETDQGRKNKKAFKQIKKSQNLSDYEGAIHILRSAI